MNEELKKEIVKNITNFIDVENRILVGGMSEREMMISTTAYVSACIHLKVVTWQESDEIINDTYHILEEKYKEKFGAMPSPF